MLVPIATRYADYDTKGHVNNAVYLTYFEIGRESAWLHGMEESPDFPFVVAEATVRYRSPAQFGDPLELEITTGEVRTKAWVWNYVLRDARDGRLVAEGSTVQVMYDYDARRSVPIPERIRAKLPAV